MSKKILVIDETKFKEQLGCFNLAEPDGNFVEEDDIFKALKSSELDVIRFEAEVSGIRYSIRTAKTLRQHIELKIDTEIEDIKRGDRLQVFVLKLKKPEGKDDNCGN